MIMVKQFRHGTMIKVSQGSVRFLDVKESKSIWDEFRNKDKE